MLNIKDINLELIQKLGSYNPHNLSFEDMISFKSFKLMEEKGEFCQCLLKYLNAPNASKSAKVEDMLEEAIDMYLVALDLFTYTSDKNIDDISVISLKCKYGSSSIRTYMFEELCAIEVGRLSLINKTTLVSINNIIHAIHELKEFNHIDMLEIVNKKLEKWQKKCV